jgi:hypothetical protein
VKRVIDHIAYGAWGERFFHDAVTAERVLAGINVLAGQKIDVGPMGVGPGRVVKVTAEGAIGTAAGHRVADDPVTFAVLLPASIDFSINLGVDTHRFLAELSIPLTLTARAREDLAIVIDVTPPRASDVGCELKAQGLRASITQYAANVEGELKRFVAKYVTREIEKPYVVRARTIDVSAAIDRAVGTLAPRYGETEEIRAELSGALEAEIRESETFFVSESTEPETRAAEG